MCRMPNLVVRGYRCDESPHGDGNLDCLSLLVKKNTELLRAHPEDGDRYKLIASKLSCTTAPVALLPAPLHPRLKHDRVAPGFVGGGVRRSYTVAP